MSVNPVLDVANKAVLALAEAMVTEPSLDSACTFAFKLVRAPVLRWSDDLSKTPEIPDTAPVVKVPPLVSRSTMPALVVTLPTEALPTESIVMLPVAETDEAVNFPPDARDKVPDLAVKLVKFK